ncbi:MAG: hypothetical protein QM534_00725 [Sediminibacterium sp.]|nr:hypothetical protein [Sediminibacterium sp.]
MKKHLLPVIAFVYMLVLLGCGEKTPKQEAITAPQGMNVLDLSKYGKPFAIFVPDTNNAKLNITEQSWGALEIKVGNSYAISISEEEADFGLRKADIKADEVNRFKSFIVEEPATLMWESEITQPEFHFISVQKIGNTAYTFEDIKSTDAEPFGKENIQKMLDAARSIKEIKKETPNS